MLKSSAAVDLQANDAFLSATAAGRTATAAGRTAATSAAKRGSGISRGTAAEQVLASELKGRDPASDALSMMVSSMVHMVQAGKTKSSASRWSAS